MKPEDQKNEESNSYNSPNTPPDTNEPTDLSDKPVVDADNEHDTSLDDSTAAKTSGFGSGPTSFTTSTSQFQPNSGDTTPITTQPMATAKRSKKPLLIGLAGALLVVLLGGYSAFAFWYNTPDRLVEDALAKLITSDNIASKGVAASTSEGSTLTFKYDFKTNPDNASANLDVNFTQGANPANKVSADIVTSKDTFYIKPSGVRDLAKNIYGESAEAAAMFDPLLSKIENKWIKVTSEDVKELTGEGASNEEATCVQKVVSEIRTNKTYQSELRTAYEQNRFIVVKENKGIETVNGSQSSHLVVDIDQKKSEAFAKKFVETSLFKKVDDCVKDDLKQDVLKPSESKTDDTSTTVELWVDIWSHAPTKFKLTSKDKISQLASAEGTFSFDVVDKIDVPKAETTVDDLKAEIEKLQQQFMAAMEASYSSSEF